MFFSVILLTPCHVLWYQREISYTLSSSLVSVKDQLHHVMFFGVILLTPCHVLWCQREVSYALSCCFLLAGDQLQIVNRRGGSGKHT